MLSERFEFPYHEMLVHIPLFSHRKPRNLLIIGGGDGGSVREGLKHRMVNQISLCEFDKDVIEISKHFFPFAKRSFENRRVRVYFQDGLDFLRKSDKHVYDVIINDSTDPTGPAAALFTGEFYDLAKKCLKQDGIFCTIGSTPFCEKGIVNKIDKALKSTFNHVHHYLAYVPMYQSGCWSFALASSEAISLKKRQRGGPSKEITCKYYNAKIHTACFQLPEFLHNQLYGKYT